MAWGGQGKKAKDKAFTTHIQQINTHVASKDHITASTIADPTSAEAITTTWERSLAAYHHELDILREDWALEMFGRWHLLKIRNRRHNACTHGVALLTRLKHAVLGEKMQRGTFAILGTKGSDGTDLVGPDSWRGLQRR